MNEITFLGHDNASLSMLIDLCYANFGEDYKVEIVSIIQKLQIPNTEVHYKIEGINIDELFHEQWTVKPENIFLIGSMVAKIKKTIYSFFEKNYGLTSENYSTLVHPTSIIAKTANYSNGTTIGPGSVLAPFADLNYHVSVNRNVTVGHHTKIRDFVTLNPSCNIAGYCLIKSGATIGMGANIIDGKIIGENSFIGAGSLVTKNIPDNVVAYGVPAKVIRDNKKQEK